MPAKTAIGAMAAESSPWVNTVGAPEFFAAWGRQRDHQIKQHLQELLLRLRFHPAQFTQITAVKPTIFSRNLCVGPP
jgi:hypothetical protein